MNKKKYVYWQDGDMWLGHFQEYPDYLTQGKDLEELRENLLDIYQDISDGHIPCVRRVAELDVA